MIHAEHVVDCLSNDEYRKFVILNKSNHSYALNKQLTVLFNNQSWANEPCFIIAGGTSLKGKDLSWLQGRNSIGINMSFLTHQTTINYSMDSTLYDEIYDGKLNKQHDCDVLERWRKYSGIRVFLTPLELKVFGGKDIYLVRRRITPSVDYSNLDEGIFGGKNSATGAINLALALGARQLFLLGYDMVCTTESHWHGGYPGRNLREFQERLHKYRTELEELAPRWKEAGATILNLNTESGLRCFPFGNLERILEEI
jgi:hypothetical protein